MDKIFKWIKSFFKDDDIIIIENIKNSRIIINGKTIIDNTNE